MRIGKYPKVIFFFFRSTKLRFMGGFILVLCRYILLLLLHSPLRSVSTNTPIHNKGDL